ncbi:MAG: SEC-C metal-binding domain-containing protein, partial [Crocinitomicaceae bacterium]|nr:SEC-C metal-binding domain-containing protein [Crocinitomicaceae bacterium]
DQYKNIVFLLTDGRREMQLVVNLEEAYESGGKAITTNFEKNITLGMIDNEWKEHLREMDDLRSAVHHAQYEQKDPLLVYKLESFELFKRMLDRLNNETMDLLMKMDIPVEQIQTTNQSSTKANSYAKAKESSSSTQEEVGAGTEANRQAAQNSGAQRPMEKQQPVTVEKTVGRNEPCPCGSGKKFKQCHGKK